MESAPRRGTPRRPRPRPARALAALVAVAVLAALVGIGWAGPARADDPLVIQDPRLDPSLAGVVVDGSSYRSALDAYHAALGHQSDAQGHVADVTGREQSAQAEQTALHTEIDTSTSHRADAAVESAKLKETLRAIAVQSYMGGRQSPVDDLLGGAATASDTARLDALTQAVSSDQQQRLRQAQIVIRDTTATIETDTARLATVDDQVRALGTERAQAQADLQAADAEVASTRRSLADWRLTADVVGTDLPLVALDAYVKAAAATAYTDPACGLKWWGLAGIGKVESGHGTFGGSRLGPDGTTTKRIIGVALDGTNGNALIPDTDGGALDGDPNLDHAVGPMQFLPSSWRVLGRDGNGDGRRDPNNIYDAALAAAGLLCRAGGSGLDTDAGLHRAALGYNASQSYADLVVSYARRYADEASRIIPPPPTTTTTAAAPPAPPGPTPPG